VSKIIKFPLIYVLAFFIFGAFPLCPLNAQDTKELENGLRVILKEDHRSPIVVFSAFIDVGSASEGGYLGSGASHLLEHMLFKGTKKYPTGDIEYILHKYGGDIAAYTSFDYTGFSITILKEHADIALDVLKEMLTAPLFDAKELEKEKQVIEREMDLGRDDPAKRISRLTFSNAYIRHPYRIPVIGYKENFKRLERADLVKFFNSNYTPERTIIAVVGDIDKAALFDKMEDLFKGMERGGNSLPVLPEEPGQLAEKYAEEAQDIDGAYLNIAFHSTGLLDRDLYALDLLSFILGQGESSILNEKIRMEKGLALSVGAYNYTPRYPGLFIISSVLKDGDVKDALDEIIKELDTVKQNGVSEEDLDKAKNNFLSGYIYQKETIESQANDLALGELLTGNPRFFESYIERVRLVTLKEIQQAAIRYLRRENMTVAVLSRSGNTLGPSPESILTSGEREIKKITLKNGLPVLVSESPHLPILSMSLMFKGGLKRETEETNGISNIASLMFMDGLGSMTRQEIAWFYESKGMSIKPYSANNSLGITINCLKEHTEDALKLLADLCMNPIVPEEELEREKKEIVSVIQMQDNQVFNHGHRLLKKLLYRKHPYGLQAIGTEESVNKLKRADVLGFHRDILSADNMALGIAGDCGAEAIEALTEKYFSNIPPAGPGPAPAVKELPVERVREVTVDTDKEQSLVLFGFPAIDIYSKDRYAVEIMVDMLSSQSGILFENIREESGLSYAQGAFQVLGTDPGYIAVYVLTSRQNIDKVKDIISREIRSFVKNGASDEELEKTKNHLKAMQEISMQTNASFIFFASLDELYGLGCDNYKDYNKNIDSVTAQDVKRAVKTYLTLDKCAIVILQGT